MGNPIKYTDPTGEKVDLSKLSETDRATLINKLQSESGPQLSYNATTGLLEITGRLRGGSETYRAGLSALISDKTTFNVLNQQQYTSDGKTERVDFGLYDSTNHNIVIDLSDFSAKRPEIDLGLVFYHEGISHAEKGLPDVTDNPFRTTAPQDTARVAYELNLPQVVGHDYEQRGDRYFIRVTNPRSANPSIFERLFGPGSKLVDITDVVKQK